MEFFSKIRPKNGEKCEILLKFSQKMAKNLKDLLKFRQNQRKFGQKTSILSWKLRKFEPKIEPKF